MIALKRQLKDLVIKIRFRCFIKEFSSKNDSLEYYVYQIFGLKNFFVLMLIKFFLIYLFYFSILYLFLVLLSFKKLKRKEKADKNIFISGIENYLSTYNNKIAIILAKKFQLLLNNSLLRKFVIKISLFKEVFGLFYLRIYINKALNKILIDKNLRKLIKSEILIVPRGTFTEFINLYNELKKELESLSLVKREIS